MDREILSEMTVLGVLREMKGQKEKRGKKLKVMSERVSHIMR